jgi:branched-chain amino acid transport system permease protein
VSSGSGTDDTTTADRVDPIAVPRARNVVVLGVTVAIAAIAYFVLVVLLGQDYNLKTLTLVGVFAVATLGLALLLGLTHQFSLAHAFFFALGAYVYAVLAGTDIGWSPWIAALTAVAASALIAYGSGRVLLRLEGFYFAVATLGLALIGENLLFVWRDRTGGDDGLRAPTLQVFGYEFDTPLRKYVLVTGALAVAFMLAYNISRSQRGRAARAIAVDELMAASNGVDVVKVKTEMFVISAIYASVGGALYAVVAGYLSPSIGGVSTTLEFVVAVIVGGMGGLAGPIVVVAMLRWLPIMVESVEDHVDLVYGALLVLLLILPGRSAAPSMLSRLMARRALRERADSAGGVPPPRDDERPRLGRAGVDADAAELRT